MKLQVLLLTFTIGALLLQESSAQSIDFRGMPAAETSLPFGTHYRNAQSSMTAYLYRADNGEPRLQIRWRVAPTENPREDIIRDYRFRLILTKLVVPRDGLILHDSGLLFLETNDPEEFIPAGTFNFLRGRNNHEIEIRIIDDPRQENRAMAYRRLVRDRSERGDVAVAPSRPRRIY